MNPSAALPGSPRPAQRRADIIGVVVGGIVAGFLGSVAGLFGLKLAILLVFGLLMVVGFALARQRSLVLMVTTVFSCTLLLHKKFGPLVINTEAGAPGMLVSSIDIVVILLYITWIVEGTFSRDVLRALRRPVFWAPLIGLVLYSFSLAPAQNAYLVFSELFSLLWVYALFLYFGARVRTRKEVGWIFTGLVGFTLIQFVVVVLQKLTGGVLGLGFLGVPTALTERDTDVTAIGRPFGTLIHPVFLGAVLAMIGLMGASLAFFHTDRRIRLVGLATVPICGVQIYLAQARGPLLGLIASGAVLIVIAAAYHRLTVRMVLTGLFMALVVVGAFWGKVQAFYATNFASTHLSTEVKSRLQLNTVGYRMFDSNPFFGIGLNNFTQVMDRFTKEKLLYPGFPSHNIFYLTAAETGLFGVAALVLVGVALAWNAVRLGRSRDPLYRAVGWAMFCIIIFNIVAEQLSYSTREEVPLTIFWLLAGIMMACLRMKEDDKRAMR